MTRARVPIESAQPMVVFAFARLVVAGMGLALVVLLGLPYEGRLMAVLAGLAAPWSLFNLWLARRAPERSLHPAIAGGDLLVLAAIEAVAPNIYGPVRFMALFFLAVHAHFQGERMGLLVGVFALAVLVPLSVVRGAPVDGDLLAFYEGAFGAAALATVVLVGGFRTAESASRLRAREISRRTLRAENEIRRSVSQALHDGPVQELTSLNLALAAARNAVGAGESERARALIEDARETVARHVAELRDEMLDLGPYAYEEFSFEAAVERCLPVWKRRFDLEARVDVEVADLPSEVEGELFRVVQESVSNAARHGSASSVTVTLRRLGHSLQLEVTDDGSGFRGTSPLAPAEPGHIGLGTMRERAELLGGKLEIDTSSAGTTVKVTAPLPR